jgi:hypothetical protein
MSDNEVLLEDVLDQLMLEEPTPNYAAFLRWKERYPMYAEELENFFVTWAMAASRPKAAEIDEERLVEQGVNRALDILRKQGRLPDEPQVETLEPLDQLVLSAIYLLQPNGDIVSIARKVTEMSERPVLPGSTLVSLSRLEDRGLTISWDVEPDEDSENAGETTQYFTVTLAGERALAHAKESSKVLGNLLGDFA